MRVQVSTVSIKCVRYSNVSICSTVIHLLCFIGKNTLARCATVFHENVLRVILYNIETKLSKRREFQTCCAWYSTGRTVSWLYAGWFQV